MGRAIAKLKRILKRCRQKLTPSHSPSTCKSIKVLHGNRIFKVRELCAILDISTPEKYMNVKNRYVTNTILFNKLEKKGLCKKQISTGENFSESYYQKLEKRAQQFNNMYQKMKTFKHSDSELLQFYVDYLYTFNHLGYTPYDYFVYEIWHRTPEEADAFINSPFRLLLARTFNQRKYTKLFNNKVLFNNTFNKYINRDWLYTGQCTLEDFTSFAKKHPRLLAKPTDGLMGRGIEIIAVGEKDIETVFKTCRDSKLIVEEIISNTGSINELNDTTINTVRICTLLDVHNEPNVVMAGIRVGRKDGVADNLNRGGLLALIDVETGKIISDGMDLGQVLYDKHPDSGTTFKGFQIPQWHKVIELAKDAARVVPQVKLVGWDIAITSDDKIEFIEGNHNPDLHMMQEPDQIGKKHLFQKYIDELNDSKNS